MTRLAPTLEAFFTTRLSGQLGASTHTIAAYRDTWRLLLRYAADTTGTSAVLANAPAGFGPTLGAEATIDEVHISDTVRSAAWIAAEEALAEVA